MARTKVAELYKYDPSEPHGFGNIRADICFICHGKLKAPDGSHCETFYDDGIVAFAAAICRACKTREREQASAKG
jgi:hypothetical protein